MGSCHFLCHRGAHVECVKSLVLCELGSHSLSVTQDSPFPKEEGVGYDCNPSSRAHTQEGWGTGCAWASGRGLRFWDPF